MKTSGIDTVLTYNQNLANVGLVGKAGLRVSYTHLLQGYTVPAPGSDRDYFGNEIGAAKDRFTTNFSYDLDNVGLTVTGTYVGASYLDDQFVLPSFEGLGRHDKAFRVGSQFYLDSQLRFRTGDGFEFYVGGSNLLNNKPPYLADIGASSGQDTDAGTYDALGRRYYAGIRLTF